MLYVLAIEPLLARFRGKPGLAGIRLPGDGGQPVKVAAYADNISLFLSADTSFPAVVRALEVAAKVNFAKSAVMGWGFWSAGEAFLGGVQLSGS